MGYFTISDDSWVSANTESGISSGNEFKIMNNSNTVIYMILSDDQPDDDAKYGYLISSGTGANSYWTVEATDPVVWLKSAYGDAQITYYIED